MNHDGRLWLELMATETFLGAVDGITYPALSAFPCCTTWGATMYVLCYAMQGYQTACSSIPISEKDYPGSERIALNPGRVMGICNMHGLTDCIKIDRGA